NRQGLTKRAHGGPGQPLGGTMKTAKWPCERARRPGGGVSRRWRFMAVGAVVAVLAAAGCSSSGSGGSSSGGKTTITELDYFTTGGANAAVTWYNQQYEKAHPGG